VGDSGVLLEKSGHKSKCGAILLVMDRSNLTQWVDRYLHSIVRQLEESDEKILNIVSRDVVYQALDDLIMALFFGGMIFGMESKEREQISIEARLKRVVVYLYEQISLVFDYFVAKTSRSDVYSSERALEAAGFVIESLPQLQNLLLQDFKAAFLGDPAANSLEEVMISYPYVYAIVIQRIAHLLYQKKIPVLPRIMTERAHSKTGIDIHPGATIGPAFFIDHGTGVVIGETTIIGRNVKIYQGVTLGALSFSKKTDGSLEKGIKRHPTIGDDVVIYASATILGDITVGSGAIIGGNTFITRDVASGSKVYHKAPNSFVD